MRLRSLALTALVVALLARPLHAAPPPPSATATATPPPPAKPGATPPPGGLDFNLLPSAPSPITDAAQAEHLRNIERDVRRRRLLLTTHLVLGLVTLASLAATLVVGQLNYLDKYGDGGDTGKYYNAHFGLAITSTVLFAATGTTALLAPNPYPKPIKLDVALLHKVAMAIAAAGMIAQVVLGPITASREGHLDQRDWALAHLVTGYATFGFMAAGVIAFVFP